jgi:ATP-binding cassette subfamily F protein 3
MIILRDIELRRGSKLLFRHANATIQPGQRVALIGANGCGKSSLFALLLGQLGADAGEVEGSSKLRRAHMAQEVVAGDLPGAEYVLQGDAQLAELRARLQSAEAEDDYATAGALHAALEEIDGYSAERRVARLMRGLGFEEGAGERPVSAFSGGWRIRLNLARALMTPSDLLLLDEPTNHLDLDATLWLQQWLQRYPGTLLMISHDRDFIDATCDRVLHIEGQGLHGYRGNYSAFESQRAEALANRQASYEKQQRRAADIEDFVRRFRYKASKARQAQSRLKELERLQTLAPAHLDAPFDFSFPPVEGASDPLLRLDQATLGHGGRAVLSEVDVVLRPGDRLGLLGRNGAGKSTLLKSLVGRLPLLAGERTVGERTRIGYFDQQQLEVLDLEASAALHLRRLRPEAREQEILDFLGGFDFRGDLATAAIRPFSGGEKARLALALLVWNRPNLLVLDEPTNHLDLEMRHALELALQGFEGAVVLVSHDRHMLRNSVDELLLVQGGAVTDYGDDMAAYERFLLGSIGADSDAPPARPDTSRREQRQAAAAQRERLRPLKRRIEQTEHALDQVGRELDELQQRLAEPGLYSAGQKPELESLLRREGELKAASSELEERWLEDQQALEALEAGGG